MRAKIIGTAITALLAGCEGAHSQVSTPSIDTKSAAASQDEACPGRSFDEFLRRFASDERIRDEYTMPSVAVAEYEDPSSPEESAIGIRQVPKAEYADFTLKYLDGAYHNVDASGLVDPAPVEVSIERLGLDYRVRYLYGMSEGNSWTFRKKGRCWFLAEDPEPASL